MRENANTRLRNSMALFSPHAAWIVLRDETTSGEERRAAAPEVALDLVRR